MPDYDLSGLSARSFEKLIQSVSGKVLGPGTVTFGDGPDGGREATFEGRTQYPSIASPWSGYCVVQAKFLQRPRDSRADARWVITQLEGELKAFADPEKGRRCPEYYVLATNVALTPVPRRGGRAKVAALFRRYEKKVPIREWAVWDFYEVCKFLDAFSDIRTAYAAWVTPGDVLSEVMAQLSLGRADFLSVMTRFVASELRSDQFANLEQAGHNTEEKIPLARVFVDLPAAARRFTDPPPAQPEKVRPFVAQLLEHAAEPLDPASLMQKGRPPGGRPIGREGPEPGRYVLVGGPGQGKTTVGQFACQLFRVALLRDRPRHLLTAEVRETLSALQAHCQECRLQLPQARRFPLRVTLSEFAAALNLNRDLSLLSFVARQVERRTDHSVSVEDLRTWLAKYPWFVVLDGLDEVPASTNREDLLKKIEDFWIEAAQLNADILVLATTRPQGYSDDFSPDYYQHVWLVPLSPSTAMGYAKRLVEVRYAGEPDRQHRILARLATASQQEATARLMRSPLQVTIMAALVDQTGTPPQDRWRLFHDYYEVIYNRERERPIPAAELLREYRPNIDAIHHHVGLFLQTESERAGGTEAKLSADRFGLLVAGRLEEEGFSGPGLEQLRDRLIDAATNRLVFLVGLETGQVGFEIRSLQEYAAAEAIMTGKESWVQERLRRIASIASWRNVFLFAAGRCFVREQHLRDTIHTICVELNLDLAGAVGRAAMAGSALALELIEDGVARRQPKYAHLLAQCALRVLELPPTDIQVRLADACDASVEPVIRAAIEAEIGLAGPGVLGPWTALLQLVARGVSWAADLAARHWPPETSDQLALLSLPSAGRTGSWMGARLDSVLRCSDARDARPLVVRRRESPEVKQVPFYVFARWFELPKVVEWRLPDLDEPVSWGLAPTDWARRTAAHVELGSEDVHPSWLSLIEGIRFAQSPSTGTLVQGLRHLAEVDGAFPPSVRFSHLSWVFGSCVDSVASREQLENLANHAEQGALGDLGDWLAAERRWGEKGVKLDDLLHLSDDRWPFDRDIGRIGLPLAGLRLAHDGHLSLASVEKLLLKLSSVPRAQRMIGSQLFLHHGHWVPGSPPVSLPLVRSVLEATEGNYVSLDFAFAVAEWGMKDENWLDILDELGTSRRGYVMRGESEAGVRLLADLLQRYPSRPGPLPLLANGLTDPPFFFAIDPDSLGIPSARWEPGGSPRTQWAGVALELMRGGLSTDRAVELADVSAKLQSQGVSDLKQVLDAVARLERFDSGTERYVLELARLLPKAEWAIQSQLTEALDYSLRRRGSGITQAGVWSALALPGKLLDLLVASRSER